MQQKQFCMPIKLKLNHKNYLLGISIGVHIVSTLLVVFFVDGILTGVMVIVILLSTRIQVTEQSILNEYIALCGAHHGRWSLLHHEGKQCHVKLVSFTIIGPLMLVQFRRYGHSYGWLTFRCFQEAPQWHRTKVFSQFYLSP